MKKFFAILFFISLFNNGLSQKKEIQLTDIWASRQFFPRTISDINSMKDGKTYTTLESDGVAQHEYQSGKLLAYIVKGEFENYIFSGDENWLLVGQNTNPIYRHSFTATYQIYNRKSEKFTPLFNGKPVQEPTFSPSNDKVAFVFENNLYYQDLKTNSVTQITKDGEKNKIINGITDWVYEEEFAFVKAFDWNQTGTHVAYIRFDESAVKEMNLPIYGNGNYPSEMKFKYPKAGEKNSTVSVKVYDVNSQKNTDVALDYKDFYIPKIQFSNQNPNDLFVLASNRHQNKLDVLKTNTQTLKNQLLFTETNKAWIDTDDLVFKQTQDGIIWKSERDGFAHLYLVDEKDGAVKKQLTKGNFEISSFYGENNGKICYQSTEEGSINRSVYCSDIQLGTKKKMNQLLGTNEASFSTDLSYFINTFSTVTQPHLITLNDGNTGKEIKVLEDNKSVQQTLNQYNMTNEEFTTFKLENGVEANAWVIKPSKMEKGKKYPVLMYVYGGPGFQTVKNEWGYMNRMWFQQIAQLGYVVLSVDGRGTAGKGAEFKKATYKQLGKLEIEDQIAAAKYLQKLDYVDPNRIGMFGWSFGGYMTSLAMTKGNGLFKMGIAVAPVTNWRFYDSVYTERFLQTPEENPLGYDDNSPINFAQQLQGKYLLIHGTADDNVHYQNSMLMAEALVQANKDFDMHSYTDKNHGIYGGYTRLHLYKKMTDYILKNL